MRSTILPSAMRNGEHRGALLFDQGQKSVMPADAALVDLCRARALVGPARGRGAVVGHGAEHAWVFAHGPGGLDSHARMGKRKLL